MNPKFEPSLTPLRRGAALCVIAIALGACSRDLSAQSTHAAAAGASALAAGADPGPAPAAAPPTPALQAGTAELALRGLPDFSALVDRYGPAVVNVEVVEKAQAGAGGLQLSPNDPFYDFFRRFGIPAPGEGQRGNVPPARGAGSGFIINSDGFSRTGGFMGVSFAIPIDVARNVGEQLIKTGRVVRGRIGVTIQDVNAQLAESFGLARPHGALVSSVEKDGPAARAGIVPGDVILSVGGHAIERYGELSGAIAAMRPGADASITVWREGKEQNVGVKVAELKEQQQLSARSGKPVPRGTEKPGALGLTVRPLSPEEKEQAKTQGSLVVEDVAGPAQAAEVEPGDIILGINGKRVHTPKELQDATQAAGKNVALLIQRGDAQIFVPLRLP